MAFIAGNIPVFPVKRKSGEGMVEHPCLPVEVIMAFKARCALGAELPHMHLPVAFQAIGRESGEILALSTRFSGAYMAGPARLFPVCPFQQVARGIMVKGDIVPAGVLVASQAILAGIVLWIQNCSMNVFVAVAALFTDLPELPAFTFAVAVETGDGLVSATKGKGSFSVSFDGVQCGGKSPFGVTLGAVG